VRLTIRVTALRLARPLRISRSVMAARDAVWITLTHGGDSGHGEIVASGYLRLTAPEAVRAVRAYAEPALARHSGPENALAALREGTLLPPDLPPGVTAAVDAALLDLVGKRAGPLALEVNETMADLAQAGRRVVRLKSGDATIFDRIGEEVAALEARGVGCDVVPGVVAEAPPVTPWRQALPAA
jgi:L-Ala-D/L-Glu epimerase